MSQVRVSLFINIGAYYLYSNNEKRFNLFLTGQLDSKTLLNVSSLVYSSAIQVYMSVNTGYHGH